MPGGAEAQARLKGAPRLCFFAHYQPQGIVTDCVLHYLREIRRAGFEIVVATAAPLDEVSAARLRSACTDLIRRENSGYDFGGWAACFAKWSPISADLLLLCNDSVYGPFGDLNGAIDRLCEEKADAYSMVGLIEQAPHLQSWFLLLRPSAYGLPAAAALLKQAPPPSLSKSELIRSREIGLSRVLRNAGLQLRALYDPTRHGLVSRFFRFNPSHILWRELVEGAGIPFIKVELLRDNPQYVENVQKWRALAPETLRECIDTDLALRRSAQGPTPAPSFRWNRFHIKAARLVHEALRRDFRFAVAGRHGPLYANALAFIPLFLLFALSTLFNFLSRRSRNRTDPLLRAMVPRDGIEPPTP